VNFVQKIVQWLSMGVRNTNVVGLGESGTIAESLPRSLYAHKLRVYRTGRHRRQNKTSPLKTNGSTFSENLTKYHCRNTMSILEANRDVMIRRGYRSLTEYAPYSEREYEG